MIINAKNSSARRINEEIRKTAEDVVIEHCNGERYLACGGKRRTIEIHGTGGNDLGCYLNGASITLYGNAQEGLGDTMNDGEIIVHGNCGDACGYAMRGGRILIRGNAGYRCGVHMKAYQNTQPLIVIGGSAGSFLGEYLAGGRIIVLGLDHDEFPAGNFIGTGMYAGEIYIRSSILPESILPQLHFEEADALDMKTIKPELESFSKAFDIPMHTILDTTFYRFRENPEAAYQQSYVQN